MCVLGSGGRWKAESYVLSQQGSLGTCMLGSNKMKAYVAVVW